MKQYYVYLVRCADETIYCGYTVDLKRRLQSHNSENKGAKYTKIRRPVSLVYSEIFQSKSEALKRECQIKKMSRTQKLELINVKTTRSK